MSDNSSGDTKPVTSFDQLPATAWDEPAPETTSPVADPAPSETAADPSPESATASPAATTPSAATPPEAGPIPLDRHRAILEGERTKFSDLDAKYQRIAWADELVSAGKTPEQVRDALAVFDSVDTDPIGYMERLFTVLQQHPNTAPLARALAGRVLGTHAAGSPAGDEPEPGPDYQTADGAKFYSVEQQAKWMAWREQRLMSGMDEKIRPLLTAHQEAQHTAARRAADEAAAGQAISEFEGLKDKPYFAEHKAEILAYLQQHKFQVPLQTAYLHVLETKVIPGLKQNGTAQAVADLQREAHASSLKPSGGAPVAPKSPTSFNDPSLKW